MKVSILAVPYDSGHRRARMGRGPEHLLASGLPSALGARGHEVDVATVEARTAFAAEIVTAFELQRLVAERVRASCAAGRFPLVLAGNCSIAGGILAGLGGDAGIAWFDAHGDFNTPDTSTSGFLDGMALAIAVGRCWGAMAARAPGFDPVPEACVILAGARDLDRLERAALSRSNVSLVSAESIRRHGPGAALEAALAEMSGLVSRIYLHVDLDVLDPGEGRVNGFPPTPGIAAAELFEAVGRVGRTFAIAGAAITAYDPDYDPDDRVLAVGVRLAETILEAAGLSRKDRARA